MAQDMPTGPTLTLRLRTRWRRDRLDDKLVCGVDPATSPELSFRAVQLQSRDGRSRLANAIAAKLGGANARAEVREYGDNLRALVERLRDDQPIDLQGVAMTARLVYDKSSPLNQHGSDSLSSAVLSVRLAVDRTAPVPRALSEAA